MNAISFVFVNFQYVMDWAANILIEERNWYISHQNKKFNKANWQNHSIATGSDVAEPNLQKKIHHNISRYVWKHMLALCIAIFLWCFVKRIVICLHLFISRTIFGNSFSNVYSHIILNVGMKSFGMLFALGAQPISEINLN